MSAVPTASPGLAPVWAVVAYSLRESLRRRVLAVVLVLTAAFVVLYGLGVREARREVRLPNGTLDAPALVGGTLLGLAMFGILFLGAVLAVFLTLGTVRGDAERGVLQPLVVRPIGRVALLGARFLAASAVCVVYVAVVYVAALVLTGRIIDWWPDHVVVPGLALVLAVTVLVAVSLLGSVLLSPTANGIAVFMVFGAGLTAGLLGQVGEALRSHTLRSIGRDVSWALPFEALYQAGLHALTAETGGVTGVIVRLGPFGGAQGAGLGLVAFALAYLAVVLALAALAFVRRDL